MDIAELFELDGRVAVVTGGTGAIGRALALGLAAAGARVAVIARRADRVDRVVEEIEATGAAGLACPADVLDLEALERVRDRVLARWGRIDFVVNAAGGNLPQATLPPSAGPFDLSLDGLRAVIDLNVMGTVLPTRVFGLALARGDGEGCIVNISSLAADRGVTRVAGYGAAKAAVESLTRSLAVEAARGGLQIRVNAIVPGFFLGDQNRDLLIDKDGRPTARGRLILERTPAGRFGEPGELISTVVWLCGPGARFVNGAVVAVDGGFSAFSGV